MNDAETSQQAKYARDVKFRGPVWLQPHDQTHDEKSQAIEEIDHDDILREKLGYRIHRYTI